MELKSIIIDPKGLKLTSDEKDLEMLKQLEKQFGTGPIISEAREIILMLSRNIMVLGLMLESMGMDIKKREEIFHYVNAKLEESDKEILAERAKS